MTSVEDYVSAIERYTATLRQMAIARLQRDGYEPTEELRDAIDDATVCLAEDCFKLTRALHGLPDEVLNVEVPRS